jgi:hypothetical protein
MDDYVFHINHIVNLRPGITGIDLNMTVMNRINPVKWDSILYLDALKSCKESGTITAFYFKIPSIPEFKAIYFPKNTELM